MNRAATLIAVAISVTGCLSTADQADINTYLLCDDCVEGESQRVEEIGWRAIPRLEGALIGPPPQRVGHMEDQYRASYLRLAGVVTVPESAYVASHVENYVASYQIRAARALAEVGTSGNVFCLLRFRSCRSQAVNALNAAVARDTLAQAGGGAGYYRGDVLLAIRVALGTLTDPQIGLVAP